MKLGLAGDTMLGRKVGAAIAERGPESLVAEDVVAVAREADLLVLNLECCISERGERWPDPGKPFFFRAPPAATETLRGLGVSCVTLSLLRPSGGVRGRSGLAWNRVRARVASAGDKASGCGRGARDAALGPEHGA